MLNIHLATDHAGFALKEQIKSYLLEKGYQVIDHGALKYQSTDDYPDYILPAAKAVLKDINSFGLIFGGSGQGEAMQADRLKGIRATVYYGYNSKIPSLSKQHNNSNILSIGARFVPFKEAIEVIDSWLNTAFEGGRHNSRVQKLDMLT